MYFLSSIFGASVYKDLVYATIFQHQRISLHQNYEKIFFRRVLLFHSHKFSYSCMSLLNFIFVLFNGMIRAVARSRACFRERTNSFYPLSLFLSPYISVCFFFFNFAPAALTLSIEYVIISSTYFFSHAAFTNCSCSLSLSLSRHFTRFTSFFPRALYVSLHLSKLRLPEENNFKKKTEIANVHIDMGT